MANLPTFDEERRHHPKLSCRPPSSAVATTSNYYDNRHAPMVMKRSGYGEAVPPPPPHRVPASIDDRQSKDVMKRSGSRPEHVFKIPKKPVKDSDRPEEESSSSTTRKSHKESTTRRTTNSHKPSAESSFKEYSKSHISSHHKTRPVPAESSPKDSKHPVDDQQQQMMVKPYSPDASSNTGIDIFPTLSDKVPSRLELNVPTSTTTILSFIIFLRGLRVYFHTLASDVWTANINRLFAESQKCNSIEYGKLDWARAEHRLDKPPTSAGRHNEDVRLGFRWDNVFLVKMFFTFGQRTPDPVTVHLIQTSAAPILYYQYNASTCQHGNKSVKKRHYRTSAPSSFVATSKGFSAYDQFLYDRYVLQPFSIYLIRPGTTYVLLTCQKTLFRFDVIRESVAENLERRGVYRFASPTADRVLRPNASMGYLDRPPATPVWNPPPADTSEDTSNSSEILEVPYQPTDAERNIIEEMFKDIQPTEIPAAAAEEAPPPQQETAQLMLVSTGDQLTWIVQPPSTQQQQQQPPSPQLTTTKKDAEVNTEEWTCCNSCIAKKSSGLGIARKRIEMCYKSFDAPKKRQRVEQQPLDLSSCKSITGEITKPQQTPTTLPPAPSPRLVQDNGLYKPESDDEYEDDEEEEDPLPTEDDEEEQELPTKQQDVSSPQEPNINFSIPDFLNEEEEAVAYIPQLDDDHDMFWNDFM